MLAVAALFVVLTIFYILKIAIILLPYIVLFVINIRKPNTEILILVLTVFFSYLIAIDKYLFVLICVSVILLLLIINKIKHNYLLKYSGIVVLLLVALIDIFHINELQDYFVFDNYYEHPRKIKNYITGKVGYIAKYCRSDDFSYKCKKYKIPPKYDRIIPLGSSGCPYFEVYKNNETKPIYINKDNQPILKEFDFVEYIEYINNDVHNYYFKISKNKKYGIYIFNKHYCNLNKLIIPCEYDYNGIKFADIGYYRVVIAKKNDLYDLYIALEQTNCEMETYKLFFKNKKYIQILGWNKDEILYYPNKKPKKNHVNKKYTKNAGECNQIKADNDIIYICGNNILKPMYKNNKIYQEINLSQI